MTDVIEVVIRFFNDNYADESYMISPNSTIRELKDLINTRHPAHPQPENQRLIFCGRILNDNDSIRSVNISVWCYNLVILLQRHVLNPIALLFGAAASFGSLQVFSLGHKHFANAETLNVHWL